MPPTAVLLAGLALFWTTAVLLWIQTYRAPENVPLRFFAGALTAWAVVIVLPGLPGGPAVTVLGLNLVVIVMTFLQVSFFVVLHRGRPGIRRVRWELLLAAVVSVLALVSYLLVPAGLRAVAADSARSGTVPAAFAFSLVVIGYVTYVTSSIVYRSARILPGVARPTLRACLVVIAVGATSQAVGGVFQLCTTLLRFFLDREAFGFALGPVLDLMVLAGYLCLVVGALVPVVDGVIREVPRIRAQRSAGRALEPLWRELHAEFPELALELRSPGPARALYRRTVEIRDGLVLLSPHFDAETAERAERRSRQAGEPDGERSVSVQAAVVRGALRARRAGQGPPERAARLDHDQAAGDWRADADALVRLARRLDRVAV